MHNDSNTSGLSVVKSCSVVTGHHPLTCGQRTDKADWLFSMEPMRMHETWMYASYVSMPFKSSIGCLYASGLDCNCNLHSHVVLDCTALNYHWFAHYCH